MQAVLSPPLQPSHFSAITKLGIYVPPDFFFDKCSIC
jgi:hypothetical protein